MKKNNKWLWVITIIVAIMMMSTNKKEWKLNQQNDLTTGQMIGSAQGSVEAYNSKAMMVLSTPQGINSDLWSTIINTYIPRLNQIFSINNCSYVLDIEASKGFWNSCSDFLSSMDYMNTKYTEMKNGCPAVVNADFEIQYTSTTMGGRNAREVKVVPSTNNTPPLDFYVMCSNENNFILLFLNNYPTEYLTLTTEPATLIGFVPFLIDNYGKMEGNTGWDTCKVDADCYPQAWTEGQPLLNYTCKDYFCELKDTPASCGDGSCNGAETCGSCASDCACASGKTCTNNACVSDSTGSSSDTKSIFSKPMVWIVLGGFILVIALLKN